MVVPNQKIPWAENLAKALDGWCKEHRYLPKNRLAHDLNITPKAWQHISAGKSINTSPEIYAALCLRTGLKEADPRTIPPRVGYSPRNQQKFSIERAWTEEQWQTWLKEHAKDIPEPHLLFQESSEVGEETEKPSTRPFSSLPQHSNAAAEVLGALATFLAPAIADQVMARLEPMLKEVKGSDPRTSSALPSGVSTGSLIKMLNARMSKVAEGSAEDRDEFAQDYREGLIELLRFVDVLTRDRDDRESQLKHVQKFGGRL